MASMVDRHGEQMDIGRRNGEFDPELAKDMLVLGHRSQGRTFREIALIMGVSHVAVYKRWRGIHEEARRYYSRPRSVG